jgi:hypothetical protein
VRVDLIEAAKGRAGRALPPTTLHYETGTATLAVAETEQRPTVLGLLASGRMRPDAGRVTIDGRADAAALRRAVALVDALDVSEPEPNVTVAGVVAEELMFAGSAPNPFAARRWLEDLGFAELAGVAIGQIEPGPRVRILLELAALREGVRGIVLTSPDRHGGEPEVWWRLAQEFADRGLAVLVIAGVASHTALTAHGLLQPAPAEFAPEPPEPQPEPEPEPEPEPASPDPRIATLPPNRHLADASDMADGREHGESAEHGDSITASDPEGDER